MEKNQDEQSEGLANQKTNYSQGNRDSSLRLMKEPTACSAVDFNIDKKINSIEQDFEFLFQHSGNLVFILEDNGVCKKVSANIQSLLGYKQEEIISEELSMLFDQLNQAFINSELRRLQEEDLKESISVKHLRKKNGEFLLVECTISKCQSGGWFCICKDMTDREAEQNELLQREKLNIVGQLATGIAHEIRNPLTAIKGFLSLLKHTPERKVEYIQVMESEIGRIEAIASEMLLLGKPVKNKKEIFDGFQLVSEVVSLLLPESNLRGIWLELENNLTNPINIKCNVAQVKQVLINLIKNAIDASEQGQKINIRVHGKQGKVIIEIQDYGCGMSSQEIERLGEPFFTKKENGTGLGLLISYNIIREHKGSIEVESTPNMGTIFSIELPVL